MVNVYSTHAFSSAVSASPTPAVTWQISCHAGGAACGAISQTGLYHAPNSVPTTLQGSDAVTDSVTVTAVSQADPRFSGNDPVAIHSLNQQAQSAPIQLGASGSNANDFCINANVEYCGAATLGALVTRAGTQYILSNSHVLTRPTGGTVGDAIIQPGLLDTTP